jgi:cytochrome c
VNAVTYSRMGKWKTLPLTYAEEIPLKNILVALMLAVTSLVFTAAPIPAAAADGGTLDEAKALVKKAREYLRKNGREKAFAEFDKRDGQFVDRDMYIYVYDKNLKNLAHGGNAKLIGKDLADMRDPDGLFVNRGLLEAAQKGGGTFTFKFFNPVNSTIQSKIGYAEMEGDLMVGSGVYTK